MDETLSGIQYQCAWVIGAGGGIGAAIAGILSEHMRNLHICDRIASCSQTRYAGTARAIIHSHVWDMANQSQAVQFADAALAGSEPPDLLVVAAGEVSYAKIQEVATEELETILRNNFELLVYSLQVFYRSCDHSPAHPKLVIIIGSNAALEPRPNQPIYAATKAAVHSLVASLAIGWADRGIALVGIEPGTVLVDRNRDRVLSAYPTALNFSDLCPLVGGLTG